MQKPVKRLCKIAAALQHHDFDFELLYKHIAIMWKSPADFPKLKMLKILMYLLQHKFHLVKNCIFVAIYSFSQNQLSQTKKYN